MTTAERSKLRTFYSIVARQTLSIIGSRLSGLAIEYAGWWSWNAKTGR